MPTVGPGDEIDPTQSDLGEVSVSRPGSRPSETRRSRMRPLVALVVVAVVSAWVVLSRAEDSSSGRSTGDSVIQQFPVGDRQGVERFSGELLDGRQFDSAELSGQVVVYNVWGSWCVPCRKEAPVLVKVANENAGRVSFVGINVRDSADAARAFERRQEVPYPSIRSEDSDEAFLAFGSSLAVAAVPTTVVVDRDGRIAARIVGPTTYVTLSELVDEALSERAGKPTAAGISPGW